MSSEAVIWHDLECGSYTADLPLWLELAERSGPQPILDIGAGTGRVALALARAGHRVIALEHDGELAAELGRRASGLPVEVVCADACAFALDRRLELAIVPMQTVHLLADRPAFLRCARAALSAGGLLVLSLLGEGVEPFELELDPDAVQLGEVRYESAPTALRRDAGGAVLLERRRTTLAPRSAPRTQLDVIRLERCDAETLAAEAAEAGFALHDIIDIAATAEHTGSVVLCLEASA